MREIKFQVFAEDWEGTEKCFDGYFLHLLDDGRYRVAFTNSDSDKEFVTVDSEEIRFFTGLYDKNGTPIYEGDIVQFTVNSFGVNGIEKNLNKGAVYYNEDMTLSVDGWMLSRIKSKEVIGNIYENPELVGEQNERD